MSVEKFKISQKGDISTETLQQDIIKPIIGIALAGSFIADKKRHLDQGEIKLNDLRQRYRDVLEQLGKSLEVIHNDFPNQHLLTDVLMNNLAWIYTHKEVNEHIGELEWDSAIDLAKRAVMNNTWADSNFLDTLAMAYLNKGSAVSDVDQRKEILKLGALFIEMAKEISIDQNNPEIDDHCEKYKMALKNDELDDINCSLPKK
jgi:hypothetical protein